MWYVYYYCSTQFLHVSNLKNKIILVVVRLFRMPRQHSRVWKHNTTFVSPDKETRPDVLLEEIENDWKENPIEVGNSYYADIIIAAQRVISPKICAMVG